MNVYVVELARRLAARNLAVEIFTRATSSALPPTVEAFPGVTVHHVHAGPFEGLTKAELPGQLCAFAREVLRAEARHDQGWYDVVHSHYWLSGQVGALVRDRWGVPLVHSMHTMAKVKNASLAAGDAPEPTARVIGEEQVVEAADMLVANTDFEAKQLLELYGADPARVEVVHPGVDLDVFRPSSSARVPARAARGRGGADVRRAHPAAEGPRRAAARRARAARPRPGAARAARRARGRRPVRHRPGAPRVARPARRVARRRRRRAVRAARGAVRAGRLVRRRDAGVRAVLQRVLRPGRRGGAGLRHSGGRGRGRRADDRGARRRVRAAGRGSRPGRLRPRDGADRAGPGAAGRAVPRSGRPGRAVRLGADRRPDPGRLPRGGPRRCATTSRGAGR